MMKLKFGDDKKGKTTDMEDTGLITSTVINGGVWIAAFASSDGLFV